MAEQNRTNNVWDISVFPYFGGYSVCKRVRRWDGDWKSKRREGEMSIWASVARTASPSLEAHGNGTTWCVTPHERSSRPSRIGRVRLPSSPFGGDAVAFVCRRRWAPRSGFSAQALKSEIRVALRRRHADASHHALPSTGHSPRQA